MSRTLPRPAGSELEEAILRHVDEHLTMERQVMADYAVVAETSPDAYVRYLSAMILDDERRHHRLLLELRNRVESDVTWRETDPALPRVTVPTDRDQLSEVVARFIDVEQHDAEELRALRRQLRPVKETSLLSLIVELMELDTEKHLRILEFVRRSVDV